MLRTTASSFGYTTKVILFLLTHLHESIVYWNYEIEALYIVHTISSRDWLGISRIHIDFNKYCYMIDGSKTNDNVPLLYFTPYIQQNIFWTLIFPPRVFLSFAIVLLVSGGCWTSKFMWWIITWVWNHGLPILGNITYKGGGIYQTAVRGHAITIIKCMELSTITITLVGRIKPLVTQTDEINYHHRKSGKCYAFIRVSHIKL